MNPSTAQAQVLVDELVRGGVREAVLSPGSRNAPLAYALAEADAAGRLRLHVRVDERSAGFLAVGLARVSGRPVAVTCTSGTAVANLHPAVLEASHGGVPLVLLTADRPPELRGTGANQTTEQPGLFGPAVRYAVDLGVGEARVGAAAAWRSVVCRALSAVAADPGPAHLNVPFREPLLPDGSDDWPEPLDGRAGGAPWVTDTRHPLPAAAATPAASGRLGVRTPDHPDAASAAAAAPPAASAGLGVRTPQHPDAGSPAGAVPARTLVVVGDVPLHSPVAAQVAALSAYPAWPVIAEPSAGAAGPAVLRAGAWLLGDRDWLAAHRPDRVLVVGRPTLSRAVAALLRDPAVQVDLLPASRRWSDPGHVAARLLTTAAPGPGQPRDDAWADAWYAADAAAAAAVDAVLDTTWQQGRPPGIRVARDVVRALPEGCVLTVGSSAPVRDVDLTARVPTGTTVVANRGLAGIDGLVSTAVGAALAAAGRPAYALLGDLTFLHDSNGLLLGPGEPRPDLTVVVVDNDGGGIFGVLEQGAERHAAVFERAFGTPHGTDLAALCRGTGTGYARVERPEELDLTPGRGLRVLHVPADRSGDRALHARLREAVAAALR